MTRTFSERGTSRYGFLYTIGLLGVGLLLGVGCQSETDTDVRTRPEDLLDAPGEHVGETVVISGEVGRVFTPRAFTVGGADFASDLLIVSTDPIANVRGRTEQVPVAEDDIVQITGVVQQLDPEAFEEEYDVALPEQLVLEFAGEPTVVALQSASAMHGIRVSPRVPVDDYGAVNDRSVATNVSRQNELEGRVAALPNAPVQAVVQERMFWIGSSDTTRLLVVANTESTPRMGDAGTNQPAAGQEWMLHGVFRELPPPGVLRTDWGLSVDIISELESHAVYLHAIDAEPLGREDS